MAKYRIVTDAYAGYEVQIWRWWLPIWIQCSGCNTHSSIDRAEFFAKRHVKRVVKYLGNPEFDSAAAFALSQESK